MRLSDKKLKYWIEFHTDKGNYASVSLGNELKAAREVVSAAKDVSLADTARAADIGTYIVRMELKLEEYYNGEK